MKSGTVMLPVICRSSMAEIVMDAGLTFTVSMTLFCSEHLKVFCLRVLLKRCMASISGVRTVGRHIVSLLNVKSHENNTY